MKKILNLMVAFIVIGVVLSGCATDGAYGKAKTVYKAGKVVYKATGNKSKSLKALDKKATDYDDTRSKARAILDEKKGVE
ncbi:MAG: hypothetical protein DRG78_17310 [Epsilonproteobacteria bacterium]|nr:MAG: hypothetical protein DRG78_17310 [Campylobacterota bacterium]